MNPEAIFALQMKFTSLMLETQTVMALRMMGMSGMIPAKPGENERMMSEKAPAMAKSFIAASEALMRGQPPAQIMTAGIAPFSRKVRSNRRRLTA